MSEIDILDKLNVLERRINELQRMEHTSTVARWTDYSAKSTIVGWSSFTLKYLSYCRIGNIVFVAFRLTGINNSHSVTFTLPYTSAAGGQSQILGRARDNGGTVASCYGTLDDTGSTVTMYSTVTGATWTDSGTKACEGQFWYWCALSEGVIS